MNKHLTMNYVRKAKGLYSFRQKINLFLFTPIERIERIKNH